MIDAKEICTKSLFKMEAHSSLAINCIDRIEALLEIDKQEMPEELENVRTTLQSFNIFISEAVDKSIG